MRAFDEFLMYKRRIPVRGAILLNSSMDHLLLVKGWKKNANWSFPRGKINKDEDDLVCAIREVYEETGFDLQAAGCVPENRQVKSIHLPLRDQDMMLYVFRDIPMDTHFEPRTRKEISKIQWWRISDLPGFRKKGLQNMDNGPNKFSNFYMVAPFLKELRRWTVDQKKQDQKRLSSNQYLSAAMSHDELMTEEDIGAESTHEQTNAPASIDTFDGANAALRGLLKLQPPTQGLQPDAIKSPVVRENSGPQLLALLQGKVAKSSHEPGPSSQYPHTPVDHAYSQAPMPRTPQHQHPRPPLFSSMPQPPPFPIQHSSPFHYQEPHRPINYHPDSIAAFQQSQAHNQDYPSRPPHLYQSQNLIHPQPLPPNVQRAVFTGGPVHSPVPQPDQQFSQPPLQQHYQPHMNANISMQHSNAHLSNIHAPTAPESQKPPPAHKTPLTSHKLALLDAFKTHEPAQANPRPVDLPLRIFEHDTKPTHPLTPQELPADMSRRPAPVAVDLLSLFKAKDSPGPSPSALPPPKPISDAQRSNLLSLFKSPTTRTSLPVKMSATALPTSVTPSAVELSAAEPLQALGDQQSVDRKGKSPAVPVSNGKDTQAFRPVAILARPPQSTFSAATPRLAPQPQQIQQAQPGAEITTGDRNGENHKARSRKNPERRSKPKTAPEKPFQPQILKRPQPGATPLASPLSFASKPVAVSPSAIKEAVPEISQVFTKSTLAPALDNTKMNGETSKSPLSLLDALSAKPSLNRLAAKPTEHKMNLLSLFGKSSSPGMPVSKTTGGSVSPLQPLDPAASLSTRSRVGSLATSGEVRRSSQAPMSPADKNFLLSYLGSVGPKR